MRVKKRGQRTKKRKFRTKKREFRVRKRGSRIRKRKPRAKKRRSRVKKRKTRAVKQGSSGEVYGVSGEFPETVTPQRQVARKYRIYPPPRRKVSQKDIPPSPCTPCRLQQFLQRLFVFPPHFRRLQRTKRRE